ncbi:MAG: hypothetical protein NC321_14220 [Clostridium sp.]|nr:hypothetical protein [Clostridium sp.]
MDKTNTPRETHIRVENRHMEHEHAPHENKYFVIGNNKIIINEHFRNDGRALKSILEKVILEAGNNQKTA